MSELSRLDDLIAEHRNKLETLETLRKVLSDESLRNEVAAVFSGHRNGKGPRRTRRTGAQKSRVVRKPAKTGSVYQRLHTFLTDHKNVPLTIEDAAQSCNCSIGAVRQVLYRTNKNEFERHSQRGGGRPTKFWLKGIPKGKEPAMPHHE